MWLQARRAQTIRNVDRERREFAELLVQSVSRARRSVASTVVESAKCEHIDLVDCSEYDNQEMSCMLTASGMTCCVCLGRLELIKGASRFLRTQDGPARRRLHKSRTKPLE
ncbi:unnamed protein product, partial [Mesorhabditis spiculigera]